MPRTAKPPLLTLVAKRDACAALGITERSFERHFQDVFTDRRPAGKRGRGTDRKVYSDELAAAIEAGGLCDLVRTKAAVYAARRLMGRTH